MRRETKPVPSAPITKYNPQTEGKVQGSRYSGTFVTGVALLHKQAYVPVTREEKTR